MTSHLELARFTKYPPERKRVGLDQKIIESSNLLKPYAKFPIRSDFTPDNFRLGIIPRLSPYDIKYLPKDVEFIEVPDAMVKQRSTERTNDLIDWNSPASFLHRLRESKKDFVPPIPGESRVMDRLEKDGIVVSFDNLRLDPPTPENERQSRSVVNENLEIPIMGQSRIPFALGSVPDVGSFLSYVTMAKSNGMAFVSRDKLLSDIDQQAQLVGEVINYLKTCVLPDELTPNDDELKQFMDITGETHTTREEDLVKYFSKLRESWVLNVGAAIETDENKGLKRAEALYNVGCRLLRVYNPEGGIEIPYMGKSLRKLFEGVNEMQIAGGQVMDSDNGKRSQDSGYNSLIIGVAGGSQCTTAVDADIAVKTTKLLYDLRGKISIPIGIEGGGVGTHIMGAFTLGASFVSKPGEIGVSWEGSGGKYIFVDSKGNYYMVYGGEASVSAKWWKDSLDRLGRPKFVEGETGVRQIKPDNMSQTGNIKRLRDKLSNGLVFERANSITELHQRTCDNIFQVTPEVAAQSQAYGDNTP